MAVTEPDDPPYWMLSLTDGRLSWLFPEGGRVAVQDLPQAYGPNGSIYAIRVPALAQIQRTFYPRATRVTLCPGRSRSTSTGDGFRLAELLLAQRS